MINPNPPRKNRNSGTGQPLIRIYGSGIKLVKRIPKPSRIIPKEIRLDHQVTVYTKFVKISSMFLALLSLSLTTNSRCHEKIVNTIIFCFYVFFITMRILRIFSTEDTSNYYRILYRWHFDRLNLLVRELGLSSIYSCISKRKDFYH